MVKCDYCDSTDVCYERLGPQQIAVICAKCGEFIKFVKRAEVPAFTNLEWLKTLEAIDFAAQLHYRRCVQGRNIDAFIEWLDKPHTRDDEF